MQSSFPSQDAHGPCVRVRPAQSGPNFLAVYVCDLTLGNDSQAYRESARQVSSYSKMPSSFPSLNGMARAWAGAPPKVGQNFLTV